MAFGIKGSYRENPGPVYFLDDATTDRGIVFQPDVYTFAEFLAGEVEARLSWNGGDAPTVLDVGCGQGDKLAALHERQPRWRLAGVDYGANLAVCRERYPWGTWIELDLDDGHALPEVGEVGADVIICSDVIEHLVDPTALLASLRATGSLIVLSTPERDIQWGYDHMGPSGNLCHVREWNAVELHAFLRDSGFTIHHHGLTRGSDQGWAMATQLVVMS